VFQNVSSTVHQWNIVLACRIEITSIFDLSKVSYEQLTTHRKVKMKQARIHLRAIPKMVCLAFLNRYVTTVPVT